MVIGSGFEGYETMDLISNGEENLVGYDSTRVGAGTRAELGVDVVLLLDVMAD